MTATGFLAQNPAMRSFTTWRDVPQDVRGGVVALGNFDGVHLGHLQVLRAGHAARPDAPLNVLTFEPHPRELFRPEDPPFHLTLPAARRVLLAEHGVAATFELPFDTAFSLMSADAFVSDVLAKGLGAAHLVCGEDFAFGHRRGGDVAFLAHRAEALGIGVTFVPPLLLGTGPISSSRIRRALQDGYPERAAAMLGRHWAIEGEVLHGDKRGRTIGFPTANVALGRHLEPARGVYAVLARTPDGLVHRGVANIGRRPTVNAGTGSRLEAHLFDYAGDLYRQTLSVALVAFLRGERKFDGLSALRAQIAEDAAEARRLLDLAAPASA